MSQLKTNIETIKSITTKLKRRTEDIINHSKLPYIPIEYIQSTGSQWIDTGIIMNAPYGYEIDFQALEIPSDMHFYGSRFNNGNRFALMNWGNKFHHMMGNTNMWNYAINTNRHMCKVHFNGSYAYTASFDGTVNSGTAESGVATGGRFYLFRADVSTSFAKLKLYSCKLYNINNVLVKDLIPCIRKEDNVVCLYDLVNERFLTNNGTGSFIAGPEL